MATKSEKFSPNPDVILNIYDADPEDPTPGLMYFNKPDNIIRFFGSSVWGRIGIAWDDEPK